MEDKLFDLMTKLYEEMQGMKNEIQEIKETMATKEDIHEVRKELKTDIHEVRQELKADIKNVRQDIAVLEHKLGDKIDALFDAREVQIDRETEVVTNLKKVENKVDKLELRIVRNNLREN